VKESNLLQEVEASEITFTTKLRRDLIQKMLARKLRSGSLVFPPHTRNYRFKCHYRGLHLFLLFPGCETSSLALKEKRDSRVFEDKVLKRIIFGTKRDEGTVGGRKLRLMNTFVICRPTLCQISIGD
jgi:hypothetical protein